MQRIEVYNFGPIREIAIDVGRLTLLIGQQASGKSTIAKLIFFFKSLGNSFFTSFLKSTRNRINFEQDIIFPFRDQFYDLFGNTYHMPDFRIKYWFASDRYIYLTRTNKRRLKVTFSDDFLAPDDMVKLEQLKEQLNSIDDNNEVFSADNMVNHVLRSKIAEEMSGIINRIFCVSQTDNLYIVAGRTATVGYNDVFESLLRANLKNSLENQGNPLRHSHGQSIDESLMLAFMQYVSRMKAVYYKLGNLDGMISISRKGKKEILSKARDIINRVMRGKYVSSSDGEKLILPNGKFVYLRNSSSGQQESIRILQDAFYSIYNENPTFRIIEEPEAHLYPKAQMYMLQLLAIMLNYNHSNQMIITTHRPYVLSVFNNLIFAFQVGAKSNENAGEVKNIICRESWIDPAETRAYMLEDGVAADIMDYDLQQIKAEMIDKVSEQLNLQYDRLLDIDYECEENE